MQLKKLTFIAVIAGALAVACSQVTNRDDFATLLKNKTESEVTQLAGKPASVDSKDPEHPVWIYKERTFQVGSQKRDTETDVVFARAADGKLHVSEVVFK